MHTLAMCGEALYNLEGITLLAAMHASTHARNEFLACSRFLCASLLFWCKAVVPGVDPPHKCAWHLLG